MHINDYVDNAQYSMVTAATAIALQAIKFWPCNNNVVFLPHDASQSTVMSQHVVCPPVCLFVKFRYRDHIGWNTSNIISRPNSLRFIIGLTPTSANLI